MHQEKFSRQGHSDLFFFFFKQKKLSKQQYVNSESSDLIKMFKTLIKYTGIIGILVWQIRATPPLSCLHSYKEQLI